MMETPYRLEPIFLSGDVPQRLISLAVRLAEMGARLPGRLTEPAVAELAALVRIMNCYYSNLIEGHRTRPVDIEKAMREPPHAGRKPLVQEALAHVAVQEWLDENHRRSTLPVMTDVASVRELHRRFYNAMPEDYRFVQHGDLVLPVVPGAFRHGPNEEVGVGRHHAPSPPTIAAFMRAFEERFRVAAREPAQAILAIPAAHHRLNYIHPFLDGNGRVSRLMSHAMALKAGIGSGGLWSIARGLARGLADPGEYRRMMDRADTPRQGDRDGRGNLSEAALVEFTAWFLEVALDQIAFCSRLFDLDNLGDRFRRHLAVEFGGQHHGKLVSKVLSLGTLERGSAPAVLGLGERAAREVLAICVARGYLKSDTPKGPVRVGFPVRDRAWLFPDLFGDQADGALPQTE